MASFLTLPRGVFAPVRSPTVQEMCEEIASQVVQKATSPVVLVAEDNPINLRLIGKISQQTHNDPQFNCRLVVANDGAPAVELFKKYFNLGIPCSAVILDYQMKKSDGTGMDGDEAAREICQFQEDQGVPPEALVPIYVQSDTDPEILCKAFDGIGSAYKGSFKDTILKILAMKEAESRSASTGGTSPPPSPVLSFPKLRSKDQLSLLLEHLSESESPSPC